MGRLVLLLIAFPALGHAAPAGIPRDLARRRAAAISNVHYELAFDLRPKAATAPGRETLRFNLTSPQPLRLDYRDGYARRVVVNGSDIPRITANGHIALPRRTPRAGANEVDVEFESGIAPAGKAILRFEDTDDGSEYLYTLFVPMDASMAFPCFDQPDIKSTFKLAVSAPPTWTVISNTAGRRVGEVDEVSTTAFDETQPIPAAGKNARKRAQVAVARKLAVLLNVTGAVAAPSVTGPKSKRAGATASAAGSRVKEAVTVLAASRPTRHAPVPLQPPPFHEANALPGSGVAVSVTRSTENVAAQAGPHSIPAGSDATEPAGTGLRDGQRDGTRTLERRRGRAAGARGDGQRGALNEADRRGREPDAERAARAGVDASGQSFDEATKSAVSLRARDSLSGCRGARARSRSTWASW